MTRKAYQTPNEPKGDLGTKTATQAGEAQVRTGIYEGLWSALLVLALVLVVSASIYLVGVTGWKWDGITHTAVDGPWTRHAYAANLAAFVIVGFYVRACWRAKVRDWAAVDAQNADLAKLLAEDGPPSILERCGDLLRDAGWSNVSGDVRLDTVREWLIFLDERPLKTQADWMAVLALDKARRAGLEDERILSRKEGK